MAYLPADFTGTYWRILDGDIYVSSLGDDTSGNGSPTHPYKSFQKAINVAVPSNRIIVGTGYYSGSISVLDKNDLHFYADGITNIKGSLEKLGNKCSFNGFHCKDFVIGGKCKFINNCRFINGGLRSNIGTVANSLFVNSLITASGTNLYNCSFINCKVGAELQYNFIEILDCHFDSHTTANLKSNLTSVFDYCNQGPGSSVFIDSSEFGNAAAVHAAFNSYQSNGVSFLPVFNNEFMLDYTLHSTSPLIERGSNGQHIGAYKEGFSLHSPVNVSNSFALTGAALTNILIDPDGNYQLTGFPLDGSIDTKEIDLQGVVLLSDFFLYAEQSFETPNHNAVVDTENIYSHPNILTFKMRYSENPLTTEHFKVFAWGKQPTIDANGKANGEVGFDVSTSEVIYARYVHIIIVLVNGTDTNHIPIFRGTSMAYSRSQLSLNVKDIYGTDLENAQITVNDGANTVTGATDQNGCFSTLMAPNTEFELTVTKQFFEDKNCKAMLMRKLSLSDPTHNFAFILRDTAGNPIENANVTISSPSHSEAGTTSIEGFYDGNIIPEFENKLIIEKSGIVYLQLFNPYISLQCGDPNLIVVQVIEYDFV